MSTKHLRSPHDFYRFGLGAILRCQCGWERRVGPAAFVGMFDRLETLDSAKARLRCSSCGLKGQVRIAPLFMD